MPPIDAANDVTSIIAIANRRTPHRLAAAADFGEHRQAQREQHRCRRRVAHPHRDHARHAGIDDDQAEPARPIQRCQGAEREAAIEAMHEHRLGEDEAADEEKNDRVGERREHRARAARRRAEWPAPARGAPSPPAARLGHPHRDHQDQDRGEAMRRGGRPGAARTQHGEHTADRESDRPSGAGD